MKYIRQLYDWVLKWAESPYGALALFILAFAESSFFPIPPDVLLIALVLGSQTKAFRFALIATAGSVLGGLFGYYIGYALWNIGVDQFSLHIFPVHIRAFESVKLQYNEWGFWIVFTAGFTPIPYKVFTIASGVVELNLLMFLIASTVSRAARFSLYLSCFGSLEPLLKHL